MKKGRVNEQMYQSMLQDQTLHVLPIISAISMRQTGSSHLLPQDNATTQSVDYPAFAKSFVIAPHFIN